MAQPDKQALLRQVMQLTPADLAALPPEQRAQMEQLRAQLVSMT